MKKLLIRFEKRSERLKKPHDQSQKKRRKCFEEAGAVPKSSGEGLERVVYDPKSVEKFGGIVE